MNGSRVLVLLVALIAAPSLLSAQESSPSNDLVSKAEDDMLSLISASNVVNALSLLGTGLGMGGVYLAVWYFGPGFEGLIAALLPILATATFPAADAIAMNVMATGYLSLDSAFAKEGKAELRPTFPTVISRVSALCLDVLIVIFALDAPNPQSAINTSESAILIARGSLFGGPAAAIPAFFTTNEYSKRIRQEEQKYGAEKTGWNRDGSPRPPECLAAPSAKGA
jgi:hypothetical protein